MCLAYPGKIIKIHGRQALVDFDGLQKNVNISLIEKVKMGDYVTVHAGFAIQTMGEEDAWEVLKSYDPVVKIRKKNKKLSGDARPEK